MKKILAIALLGASMTAYADIGNTQYTTMCMGCHGAKGLGIVGPALNDLTFDEVKDKLVMYRAKETVGPRSGMMWGVASRLGDGDIEILAKYIEGL